MNDLQNLFARAIDYHKNSRLEEARELYLKVIDSDPLQADALHLCGLTFYQQGRAAESEAYIRSAIALQPTTTSYHSNLGLALARQGRVPEAIQSYSNALAIDPAFPDAMLNLGNAFVKAKEADRAESTFRRLLEIAPGNAEACNNLAMVLANSGRNEEALEFLRSALSGRPEYPDALANIARLLADQGRHDEAATQFELACKSSPHDAGLHRSWGDSLQQLGDTEAALAVCSRALELNPADASSYVSLGNIRQSAGEWADAESCYRQALDIDATNAFALNNLGTVFMQRDDFEAALRCFDAAIRQDPSFADATYNSATALESIGGLVKAERRYIRAIKLKSTFSEAYRCLANVYHATGRDHEALRVLEQWRDSMPEDPAPRHLLAFGSQDVAPARASGEYVKDEFDRFAVGFDKTLARLKYCAPEKIVELLEKQINRAALPFNVLDAGCGTGLGAALLKPFSDRLVGVDLSPNMLKRAELTGLYDDLVVADLVTYMTERYHAFDLIMSADTLVYFGRLDEVFKAAVTTLKPDGMLAFSLEEMIAGEDGDFRLNLSGRYCHQKDYVEQCLLATGFEIRALERAVLRQEMQQPVAGLVVVARKMNTVRAS